jgi:hypothetical protein
MSHCPENQEVGRRESGTMSRCGEELPCKSTFGEKVVRVLRVSVAQGANLVEVHTPSC